MKEINSIRIELLSKIQGAVDPDIGHRFGTLNDYR